MVFHRQLGHTIRTFCRTFAVLIAFENSRQNGRFESFVLVTGTLDWDLCIPRIGQRQLPTRAPIPIGALIFAVATTHSLATANSRMLRNSLRHPISRFIQELIGHIFVDLVNNSYGPRLNAIGQIL